MTTQDAETVRGVRLPQADLWNLWLQTRAGDPDGIVNKLAHTGLLLYQEIQAMRDTLTAISVWSDNDVREPANSMAQVARLTLERLYPGEHNDGPMRDLSPASEADKKTRIPPHNDGSSGAD